MDTTDFDNQTEAVEQLRTQFAFFGVHRADEDEACRVGYADTLALDGVDAHGCGIEENIDQMVVEEVDFVDVQQPAVGLGQQAGLVATMPLGQCMFEVE